VFHTYMLDSRTRWWVPTSNQEAHRRAGGRRAYNAVRHHRAALRRRKVLALLVERGFDYGSQRAAAAVLGVSVATISRDVAALRRWWLAQGGVLWPIDIRMPKSYERLIDRMMAASRKQSR